ncbi:MAG: hypothetical protein KME26_17415 [Oscillatoria princeps RMCB-10]|nr:hypothetical protein [Oscillatoria princeps RMCB-10]
MPPSPCVRTLPIASAQPGNLSSLRVVEPVGQLRNRVSFGFPSNKLVNA